LCHRIRQCHKAKPPEVRQDQWGLGARSQYGVNTVQ
jgi:hypothetical protein